MDWAVLVHTNPDLQVRFKLPGMCRYLIFHEIASAACCMCSAGIDPRLSR